MFSELGYVLSTCILEKIVCSSNTIMSMNELMISSRGANGTDRDGHGLILEAPCSAFVEITPQALLFFKITLFIL